METSDPSTRTYTHSIYILYKQPRFCDTVVRMNPSWYCSYRCYFVCGSLCYMQLFSAGELKGNWNRQTWSARVHKEISEDYFCNFRVNALFIILWIAEAKSGKDLRSLAEIRLALRGVAAAGRGGREDGDDEGGEEDSSCLDIFTCHRPCLDPSHSCPRQSRVSENPPTMRPARRFPWFPLWELPFSYFVCLTWVD